MRGSRPLTDEEVSLVVNKLFSPRERCLFTLGYCTGFRISELLSLTIGDVYQNGKVMERVTVQRRNMKKKQRGRTVVLHIKAQHAILSLIKEMDAPSSLLPLFSSRIGGCLSRVQAWRLLNQAYKALNLTGKLGTHAMRKTFANRVYNALGRDLVSTQQAMGHADVNSTVSYLSFCQEDVDNAILGIN